MLSFLGFLMLLGVGALAHRRHRQRKRDGDTALRLALALVATYAQPIDSAQPRHTALVPRGAGKPRSCAPRSPV